MDRTEQVIMVLEIIVRLILIGIGVLFLLLSAAGAVLELARRTDRAKSQNTTKNPLDSVTRFMEAMKALWQVFIDAPLWLALAGVGIVILLLGALLPFSFQ
jgi:hypothetical protein